MRLAVLGIRGIPSNYGGFETFAEQLAPRLAQRGHEVTVYGRKGAVTWPERYYKGVRLVVLPTIHTKHLDTPVHTILSCLHALSQRYDTVLVCNAAHAPFVLILRLFGVPVALNVDGIERLRRKWGASGRAWYWMSEYLATRIPSAVISDAGAIRDYYLDRWNTESIMIPYGADLDRPKGARALATFCVEPRGYFLAVMRLEPENNADLIVRAYSRVMTNRRLVIVGDTPYESEFKDRLRNLARRDPRVTLTGFLYGEPCRELQANSYCYIHAADVGGTSPALLESMALGGCVIAAGTPQNVEVLGGTGWTFEPGSEDALVERLQFVADHPSEANAARAGAHERVETTYSWDSVTDAYERVLEQTVRG